MPRNTEWFYFKGKSAVAKVFEPDTDYNCWYIKVHLTPESAELFKQLQAPDGETQGILNELKDEEDGPAVWFRRPVSRKFKGIEQNLTPPLVVDKDGKPTREYFGPGSDVEVKIECYKFNRPFNKGRGKAIRLLGIKLFNATPLQQEHLDALQAKAVTGYSQQPAESW